MAKPWWWYAIPTWWRRGWELVKASDATPVDVELPQMLLPLNDERTLMALGAEPVIEKTLPAGESIFPSEVGEPGPWFGWRFPDGTPDYGWTRGTPCDGRGALDYWWRRNPQMRARLKSLVKESPRA